MVVGGVGCDSRGCHGRSAALPCGRWTKWVVLGFWVVVAVAGPLAGRLNSAQQNDASAWLPQDAESTQVVELAKRFTPADVFPALVVYERPDGPITPADQARAAGSGGPAAWPATRTSPSTS
jgi:RND superfamily putative drug exporter